MELNHEDINRLARGSIAMKRKAITKSYHYEYVGPNPDATDWIEDINYLGARGYRIINICDDVAIMELEEEEEG